MPQHNPELAPLFNLFGLSSNYAVTELLAAAEDCKRRADRDPAKAWIKCADELPELDTPVWIRTADDIIVIAERGSSTDGWMWSACYGQFFADGKWDAVDGDASDEYEPTHWMALPTPPADERVSP